MKIVSVPQSEWKGFATMEDACEALVSAARSNNTEQYAKADVVERNGMWHARFYTRVGAFILSVVED